MGSAQPAATGPAIVGRARRAVATKVSAGHVVMMLAGALGVLLTLTVLRGAEHTTPVVVAARDLAPGTVVGDDALRVARVHADASVLATLYADRELSALRGQVVTTSLVSGELVARDALRSVDAHAARRVMSFAIARARAVDGKLATRDHVDVLAVDHDTERAGYVMTDAEVVAVATRDSGSLAGGNDDVTVTLAVDGDAAPRLAAAVDAGTVMLVRSTGAAALRDPLPFTPAVKP